MRPNVVMAVAVSLTFFAVWPILAPPAAAQPNCDDPVSICGQDIDAACTRRLGAGVAPTGGGDSASRKPDTAECEAQMDRYFSCVETFARLCGGDSAGADPTPAGADPRFDHSRRALSVGPVSITDLILTPSAPASLLASETVLAKFHYQICCGHGVRIWVRPESTVCTHSFSGSPVYEGAGDAAASFQMEGPDCAATDITKLRLSVESERAPPNENYWSILLPVAYRID